MTVAERLRARTPTRRWVGLGAAVLAWFALYEVNLPWWNWLLFDVVGLDPDTRLGSGVHFFFYDSVKIALLLVGIIFAVTVLRSFMSVERTRALLGGKREGVGNVMAAGLGVITPSPAAITLPTPSRLPPRSARVRSTLMNERSTVTAKMIPTSSRTILIES